MNLDFEDLKVLLVEDQEDAREILIDMLQQLGVTQTFQASNGEEAITFLEKSMQFVDVVICDWNMPGTTGMDVLKVLRKTDPALPFLMVTGRADMHSVSEAKSEGVSAYIAKPFSPRQLEAKLRIILYRMAA